ncbi:uncharacterized protein LOC134565168 isoform X2 [Prinia subflava]|uniref:uncharacterized protein LOC134565168 isoform X2 n=1 Tax=Prinia subflava TaxID=208062 RepID=UPI002FE321EF
MTRTVLKLVILLCALLQLRGQEPAEWPWTEATYRHTTTMGSYSSLGGRRPTLATVVLHNSEPYRPSEWRWDRNAQSHALSGTIGEKIQVSCRKVEGSLYEKASPVTVSGKFFEPREMKALHPKLTAEFCSTTKWKCIKQIPLRICCRHTQDPKVDNAVITKECKTEPADCWYNFTLTQTMDVSCSWFNNSANRLGLRGLAHKFRINAMARPILRTTAPSVIEVTESTPITSRTVETTQSTPITSRMVKTVESTSNRSTTPQIVHTITPQKVATTSQKTEITTFNYSVTPNSQNLINTEWPWSQAFTHFTGSMGNVKGLNLLTVVMHDNQVYTGWEWEHRDRIWQLQGRIGERISIGCRMINGTVQHKANQITVTTDQARYGKVCTSPRIQDCWYDFFLTQTVEVVCLWASDDDGLSVKFKINAVAQPVTVSPSTQAKPPVALSPKIFKIGPYIIRKTGQQQLLFNPTWSLKQVKLLVQTNVSEIQPACSPFLQTSFEGWTTWLRRRSPPERRVPRDVTGAIGTGLGILNSIDSEVLMNKLAASARDLAKLQHPLRSSLLALGTTQWLLSNILPNWENVNTDDHNLIIDALNVTQNNVSLALSCVQAQLWMQSVAASIIREGEEGIFPTEIRKIIWDNANDFEKDFQSWWNLVNFTYNSVTNTATAFVLTISNASVYTIFPIIALGLNHDGATLYPLEHREWARQVDKKWQTVNLESCIVREQQGFICESNAIAARDICLDTEQNICHFEVHPNETSETVLVYIGNGCACFRTACNVVTIENVILETKNHSNFCACNFTKITACDFSYSAPVTSYQLLQSNYTLIHKLWPTPIGMNLTLTKQFLLHQDLIRILRKIKKNRQKTLITVHHNVEEIHRVLERHSHSF